MTRLHFFRNLRTAILLLMVCTVVAAVGGLWWANATGLPEEWRQRIEHELAKQGLNVSVASLSYQPFHGGLVATEIRIFSDESCTRQISRVERVAIDFDKSRLARGELKLTKFEIKDGRLDLPVDPANPNGEMLEASHVNATIAMPGGRVLELRDANGQVEGIDVAVTARILGYRPALSSQADDDPNRKARLEILKRCLDEARNWKFDDKERPKISIAIDGDFADRSTLHGRVKFNATNVERGGHTLQKVSADAEWTGTLLTVTSLKASDRRGELEGRVDYDLVGREGRFGLSSGLDVPRLLRSWFGVSSIRDVTFAGEQRVEGNGTFKLVDDGPPEVKVTGSTACKALMIRGVAFDSFASDFSWSKGNLFMRDIKVMRRDGQLTGKMLLQDKYIRVAMRTNFPFAVARPFFVGQPFGRVLNDFAENDHTKLDANLEFGWDLENPMSWVVSGHGKVENCTYRGTPFLLAETDLDLSHSQLDFQNGSVIFDYRNYALQHAHDGARTGALKVRQVRYDSDADTVAISNVDGNFWPAPLVRMFARGIAEDLEQYRFHQPPNLQCSGLVDTVGKGRTDLKIAFKTNAPANYEFIGKDLLLESPSANVRIQNEKVVVDNLAFRTFGGPVAGTITRMPGREAGLSGEFSWTKLSFNDVGALYGFDPKGGGLLTGRLEFTCGTNGVEHLNGRGLIGLEKGELFSVPIFGPLSPLISGILGGRVGFQKATGAFCTFTIRDGVMRTNDFRTGTSSLAFSGDARIDLDKVTLDMTMRMNARGLLGVLTLPLRPFYGLFQFHGSGPLKNPEWRNVMFTSPPEDQKDALMNPPKATIIQEPERLEKR
ncbi:AsmA-like C-terminal region-containing protein [Luteolibacter sp. LG18]|uniref:AsmA-like C-terminal region-containing protein n=1 Tax=Luteolibacter sp. LG18 TaxID=2819286 RepID=UPI002B305686|nr:hypothetical protein llg_38210 [Luteolibacter sp. LG18]